MTVVLGGLGSRTHIHAHASTHACCTYTNSHARTVISQHCPAGLVVNRHVPSLLPGSLGNHLFSFPRRFVVLIETPGCLILVTDCDVTRFGKEPHPLHISLVVTVSRHSGWYVRVIDKWIWIDVGQNDISFYDITKRSSRRWYKLSSYLICRRFMKFSDYWLSDANIFFFELYLSWKSQI